MNGVTILDLSWLLPGPFATMILADLGADVIKVERPGDGDYLRTLQPEVFPVVNRNKRSVTLDLKSPEGQRDFRRLAASADVVVEGFRPGVAVRLGADYASLRAINPRLVYCSVSGFGQDGPYRDWPGHESSYQAMGGAMANPIDLKDTAVRGSSLPIGDLSSGMVAAVAIASALVDRNSTGQGRYIDVSITESVMLLSSVRMANAYWNDGPAVTRLSAVNRRYTTADGAAIVLSVSEDVFWQNLCAALGRPDWAADDRLRTTEGRLAHAGLLLGELERIFLTRPGAEWLEIFARYDVPAAPVYDAADLLADPHVRARQAVWERDDEAAGATRRVVGFPARMDHGGPRWRLMPPALGEHNGELLGTDRSAPEADGPLS